jgi:hypothetical protein
MKMLQTGTSTWIWMLCEKAAHKQDPERPGCGGQFLLKAQLPLGQTIHLVSCTGHQCRSSSTLLKPGPKQQRHGGGAARRCLRRGSTIRTVGWTSRWNDGTLRCWRQRAGFQSDTSRKNDCTCQNALQSSIIACVCICVCVSLLFSHAPSYSVIRRGAQSAIVADAGDCPFSNCAASRRQNEWQR